MNMGLPSYNIAVTPKVLQSSLAAKQKGWKEKGWNKPRPLKSGQIPFWVESKYTHTQSTYGIRCRNVILCKLINTTYQPYT